MNVTLYLVGLVPCLAATLEAWRICAPRLRTSVAWLVTCLNASLLLYLGALLPGMISCLTAAWIAATLALLSIAAIVFWNWWGRRVPVKETPAPTVAAERWAGINAGTVAVGVLALLLLAPLVGFLGDLPFQLGPSAVVLEWDTVSYHLPELIQFLQQHTLWYQGGVYSSYSFGFELMAALPVTCFHSSWPLLAIHLLGLTVAFSGLYVVVEQATTKVNRLLNVPLPVWVVFLLAAGLVVRLFGFEMSRVGKNDLYQSGAILAGVAFLYEFRKSCGEPHPRALRRFYFACASVAMGLALSAKPNALAYLPTFGLMAALAEPGLVVNGQVKWGRRLAAAMVAWAVAGAVGGFFLARNLIMFHGLIPPEHVWMMQYSLLRAILNPQKWGWYDTEWILLLSLAAAMVPALLIWRARQKDQGWWILAALLGLHVTALGAFVNTSYSVLPNVQVIVPRMGMMFYFTGAIFLAIGVVELFSVAAEVRRVPVLRLATAAAVLAAIVGSPFYYQSFLDSFKSHGGLGLPGAIYQPWGVPTKIYQIIGRDTQPLRIYAAGLRPLGLYGANYQNTLFYDLHSSTTFYNHQRPEYLMAVLVQFHPDRIIMAVDSNRESPEPVVPPLVAWMKQYPQYFTELYSDPAVIMFRVNPGWETLKVRPDKEPIRMGY